MEEKEVISLVKDLTGLDEQLITNSLANKETGKTVLKNVFNEKFKVLKKEDYETGLENRKKEIISDYNKTLIELAKKQELPRELYSVIANNIISKNNKDIAATLDISVDDYTNLDAVKSAVVKKYAKDDTLRSDLEHVQAELERKNKEFEDSEKKHLNEIKVIKTQGDYLKELNDFPIDANTKEELDKRRVIADSIFKSKYDLDLIDDKIVIKSKDGNILKHEDTRVPLTINEVFVSEISKYVPMKAKKSEGKGDVDVNFDTTVITTEEEFEVYAKAKGLTPDSNEYVRERIKLLKN